MAASQKQHHADQEEAAGRTFLAERQAALALLRTDENAGLRAFVEALCRHHNIKLLYSTGPGGTAHFKKRFNCVPEIRAVMSSASAHEALAITIHEIAHQLRGPCPNVLPHFRQVSTETGSQCCLRCELDAWEDAMKMAPMWTTPMHAQLVYGLRSYRDSTAAPVDEIRELDALITEGFGQEQNRRRKFAAQLERRRRVQLSLVPMHVRNRELDAEIQRQRKARQDMRTRRAAIEAASRKPCACGRPSIGVRLQPTISGLCQSCFDIERTGWRTSALPPWMPSELR
jgi:hypothetical protein